MALNHLSITCSVNTNAEWKLESLQFAYCAEKSGAQNHEILLQNGANNASVALEWLKPELSMDRNQEQVPAGICLFLEPKRFGNNFSFTEAGTGTSKSQINFVHERFFQLVAQFSSNLFAACAITKYCK